MFLYGWVFCCEHGGTERPQPVLGVGRPKTEKKQKHLPSGYVQRTFPSHRMASHHFKSFMWLDGTHSKFRNNVCERLVQDLNWDLFRAEPQRTHPVTYVELHNQFHPTPNLWPERRLNRTYPNPGHIGTSKTLCNILHKMSFFNGSQDVELCQTVIVLNTRPGSWHIINWKIFFKANDCPTSNINRLSFS